MYVKLFHLFPSPLIQVISKYISLQFKVSDIMITPFYSCEDSLKGVCDLKVLYIYNSMKDKKRRNIYLNGFKSLRQRGLLQTMDQVAVLYSLENDSIQGNGLKKMNIVLFYCHNCIPTTLKRKLHRLRNKLYLLMFMSLF